MTADIWGLDIDRILLDTVKEDIEDFNRARGRRKPLDPTFLNWSELMEWAQLSGRWRKYGRILSIEDWLSPHLSANVKKMAHAVIRTMLKQNPRPERVYVDFAEMRAPVSNIRTDKFICRLIIPKRISN